LAIAAPALFALAASGDVGLKGATLLGLPIVGGIAVWLLGLPWLAALSMREWWLRSIATDGSGNPAGATLSAVALLLAFAAAGTALCVPTLPAYDVVWSETTHVHLAPAAWRPSTWSWSSAWSDALWGGYRCSVDGKEYSSRTVHWPLLVTQHAVVVLLAGGLLTWVVRRVRRRAMDV